MVEKSGPDWNLGRSFVYALITVSILVQFMGNAAELTDQANGTTPHSYAFNTLGSLQSAVGETDQLAQERHFNRVYIATDQYTQSALRYLTEQMSTPTTLFDASDCLVLPNQADGPAALLVGPSDTLTTFLLKQFATTTLVDRPERLGGQPFQLYIVAPASEPVLHSSSSAIFAHHLQFLYGRTRLISLGNNSLLISRWSLMRSGQPGYGRTYNYLLSASLHTTGNKGQRSIKSECTSTALRAGDQLIVAFNVPHQSTASLLPTSLTINGWYFTTMPFNLSYGPLALETIRDQRGSLTMLRTADGASSITVPVSP